MNKVILIGRLGRDPEVKEVGQNTKICTFSVATNERSKDGPKAEWHNIVCFNRTAEICQQYLQRGSEVAIDGKLRTTSWEKDGERRYRTEVVADRVEFVGSKQDRQQQPARTVQGAINRPNSGGYGQYQDSSDVPF